MRDYEWLIPVAFGLGLAALVATPIMKVADAGDWLSFAGAFVGVGLAVAGALSVERQRIVAAHRGEMSRLKAALNRLMDAIDETIPVDEAKCALKPHQRPRYLGHCIGTFEHAMRSVEIRDMDTWSALDFMMPELGRVKTALAQLNDAGVNAASLQVFTVTVRPVLEQLRPWLELGKNLADESRAP